MLPDQRQLNRKVYKLKMNILLKILLIILSSTFLVLMIFDYESATKELSLPSKINCIAVGINNEHNFLCNACFKINPKNKINEKLSIQSKKPFLLVSLKQQISGILSCEEWLQSIDYESVKTQTLKEKSILRLEPSVSKFLNTLQNQHNQILQIKKSEPRLLQTETHEAVSTLDYSFQVVSFYSKYISPQYFRIFQINEEIKSTGVHILSLFSFSATIALFYAFHCAYNKQILKKYIQHIFCVIGILGTLIWIVFGDLFESYKVYLTFAKIFYFSSAFDVVFGAGRWLFFGIILITEVLVSLSESKSDIYHLILEILFLVIITVKVSQELTKQYFHLEKNSNKKIYFMSMTFLILACSFSQQIKKEETLGQICQFLIGFLILISFIFGVKNLDGNEYEKLMKEQRKIDQNLSVRSHETLQQTTMYEEHDQIEQISVQKK